MNETPKTKLMTHTESTAAETGEMRSRDANGEINGPGLFQGFNPRYKPVHRFDPYREQMIHMRLAGVNDQSIMDFLKSKGINLMYKEVSAYLIKHGYRLRSPRKKKPQDVTPIHMEQTGHSKAAPAACQTAPAVQAPGFAGGGHNEARSANAYSTNAAMSMEPSGHKTAAPAASQTATAVQVPGIAGGGHNGAVDANETPAKGGTAQPAPALAGPVHKGSAVAAPNTIGTPEPREHYSSIDRMAKARDAVNAQKGEINASAAPKLKLYANAEDMFPKTSLTDKALYNQWSKYTLVLHKHVTAKKGVDSKALFDALAYFVANRFNSSRFTETTPSVLLTHAIDDAMNVREFRLFDLNAS